MLLISECTLKRRINRRLRADGLALRIYGTKWQDPERYGPFFVVDLWRNEGVRYGIADLEGLGRELGVLDRGERMEEQSEWR